jgi:hypothetical protein
MIATAADDWSRDAERWCHESSWDLLRGLDVSDFQDTVPMYVMDELGGMPPRSPGAE